MGKSGFVILSIAVVAASAVYKTDDLLDLLDRRNVIRTSDGVVRLGKVNAERVKVDFKIQSTKSNEVLLQSSTFMGGAFAEAEKELSKQVAAVNKEGGIKGEDGKKESLDTRTATYKDDVKITKRTYIVYSSETMPFFELTLDNSEEVVSAGTKSIYSMISELQEYDQKAAVLAEKAPSFLGRAKGV